MPTFSSKITRMRSVKLPFNSKKTSESPTLPVTTKEELEHQQQQIYYGNNNYAPEPVIFTPPNNVTSFAETLRVISKEAKSTQFDDIFDSFFFNDKRCQNRALFMAARLKQTLDGVINQIRPSSSYGAIRELQQPSILNPSYSTPITSSTTNSPPPSLRSSLDPKLPNASSASVDSFWRLVTHRLYTLNYILFVLPSDSQSRIDFLNKMEANLALKGDGQELHRKGGMEAHFAVRYALEHKRPKRRKTLLEDAFELEKRNGGNVAGAVLPPSLVKEDTAKMDNLVEQARHVIEQCLESESKLGHAEKDAMYIFHGMRGGLHGAFEPHIELEEDRALRHRLKRTVDHNKEKAKPAYENPFEDEELIVTEEDESSVESNIKNSNREVDSGFYDGWTVSAQST